MSTKEAERCAAVLHKSEGRGSDSAIQRPEVTASRPSWATLPCFVFSMKVDSFFFFALAIHSHGATF